MLKPLKEFRKHVLITGLRGLRIENTEEFLKLITREKPANVDVQIFNADGVATWQHLYFAALNALTAFKNKMNISKSIAMETMLYASAQRQILKATGILGVKPSSTEIAILIIGEKPEALELALSKISKHIKAKEDETVLELTDEKAAYVQRLFNISNQELSAVAKRHETKKALVDLVIERMALLATQR